MTTTHLPCVPSEVKRAKLNFQLILARAKVEVQSESSAQFAEEELLARYRRCDLLAAQMLATMEKLRGQRFDMAAPYLRNRVVQCNDRIGKSYLPCFDHGMYLDKFCCDLTS